MKQFNLEEYLKNPNRVVTRDGREVRIICTDFNNNTYPIIIEVKDMTEPVAVTREGRFFGSTMPNDLDLFFATERKEGWANLYRGNIDYIGGCVYTSKEEAEENKGKGNKESYVATVKIEWEE